jgi:hypothetical protein
MARSRVCSWEGDPGGGSCIGVEGSLRSASQFPACRAEHFVFISINDLPSHFAIPYVFARTKSDLIPPRSGAFGR